MKTELTTLCYIEKDEKYLLLHRNKKDKDRSKDLWIGLGGHFLEGESPEECVLREVKEESGLTLTNYKLRGIVTFRDPQGIEYMFLYSATEFEGDIPDKDYNDEGELFWIDKNEIIGKLPLWAGDQIFLNLLMNEKEYFSLKLDYNHNRRLERAILNGKEMELFDELDEQGNPTGLTVERNVAHSIGTYHRTAHIWILRPDEDKDDFQVLLQKRSKNKDSFPGCYDISSAGHVQAGDEYEISAIREMKEELGITAKPEDLQYIGLHKGFEDTVYRGKRFFNREFARVYVYCGDVNDDEIKIQPEEVESVMWVSYKKCSKMIKEKTIKESIPKDEWKLLGNVVPELFK
jgi:8-oxo-dGTP diphosphatase